MIDHVFQEAGLGYVFVTKPKYEAFWYQNIRFYEYLPGSELTVEIKDGDISVSHAGKVEKTSKRVKAVEKALVDAQLPQQDLTLTAIAVGHGQGDNSLDLEDVVVFFTGVLIPTDIEDFEAFCEVCQIPSPPYLGSSPMWTKVDVMKAFSELPKSAINPEKEIVGYVLVGSDNSTQGAILKNHVEASE